MAEGFHGYRLRLTVTKATTLVLGLHMERYTHMVVIACSAVCDTLRLLHIEHDRGTEALVYEMKQWQVNDVS